MKRRSLPLIAACLGIAGAVCAESEGFRITGNMEIWAYAGGLKRVADSPFNPDNRIARLASAQQTAELRLNLRLRDDDTEFVIRPRLLQQHEIGRSGDPDSGDAYLSQGFVRQRLNPTWTLSAGRELLTWGPGNFRSPSNPIYFDAGKTNPLRDVPGVDLARLAVTNGAWSASVARVVSDARLTDNPVQSPLLLAKADWRGEETQLSVISATPVHAAPFFGAFAQKTIGDALLLYAEIGHGRRQFALEANTAAPAPPFAVRSPSPAKSTSLLGIGYTLENSQSIALEWLHDGHGYSRTQAQAVFAQVRALESAYRTAGDSPLAGQALRGIGQALGQAPALSGRDYLAFQWQSNPQESEEFWRINWTYNLVDRGQHLTAYYECSLSPRWSSFAALGVQHGPHDSESQRLWNRSLTLGVKLFAF